jgi:uncharacterized membrane protein YsdA (DUF1294 family)/cold shock CspA family protein
MVQSGHLIRWDDERGFGFIEAQDGRQHFVHISAIGHAAGRPRLGDKVTFATAPSKNGRTEATRVRILRGDTSPAPAPAAVPRPVERLGPKLDWRMPMAGLLALLLAIGTFQGAVPPLVAMAYCVMSGLSMLAYRLDKEFAARQQWRLSEEIMQGLDLLLGIIGGLLGQAVYRHKTRKSAYLVSTLLIAGVHVIWLGGLASGVIDATALTDGLSQLL